MALSGLQAPLGGMTAAEFFGDAQKFPLQPARAIPDTSERDYMRQMIADLDQALKREGMVRRQADEAARILAEQLRATVADGRRVVEQNMALQAEIAALKAKYEPAPPPAPNPWGKKFVGGLGASFGL